MANCGRMVIARAYRKPPSLFPSLTPTTSPQNWCPNFATRAATWQIWQDIFFATSDVNFCQITLAFAVCVCTEMRKGRYRTVPWSMISTTVLRPPRTYLLTYLPSDWLGLSREQRLMLCWDAAKDVTRLLTTPIDVVRRTDTVMAGRRAPSAARRGRVSAREAALTVVWSTATLAAVVSVFCVQPTGQSVCQSHLRWDDVVCLFLHKNTTHLTLLVEFVDQSTFSLALWRPLLPYGYSYRASCVTLQGRVKHSFVIFDIQALWRSVLSVRVPGC